MLVIASGDSLRGDASVAAVVDYSFHGLAGATMSLLAEGQLPSADGELYPAGAIVVVKSMVLVNTHSAAVAINLTILKSGSTARRLVPKDLSLGVGYSLYFEGSRFYVINATGEILTTVDTSLIISNEVYGASWNGVNDKGSSKNALYDEIQLQLRHILTAQGDIGYASAANTLTRLPKGAANTKLFMNAGATAPEWAAGTKIISLSRDMQTASGDVETTGIGYKPSILIALSVSGAVNARGMSVGFSAGLVEYCMCDFNLESAGTYSARSSLCYLSNTAGEHQEATLKELTSDGWILTWTKTGTPDPDTAYIRIIPLR